jgi:hypothetical protein
MKHRGQSFQVRNTIAIVTVPMKAYEAATLASEPLTAAFSAAKDAAAALVGELIDLHSALIDQNPDIAEAAAAVTATSDRTAGSPHHSAGHGESQARQSTPPELHDPMSYSENKNVFLQTISCLISSK